MNSQMFDHNYDNYDQQIAELKVNLFEEQLKLLNFKAIKSSNSLRSLNSNSFNDFYDLPLQNSYNSILMQQAKTNSPLMQQAKTNFDDSDEKYNNIKNELTKQAKQIIEQKKIINCLINKINEIHSELTNFKVEYKKKFNQDVQLVKDVQAVQNFIIDESLANALHKIEQEQEQVIQDVQVIHDVQDLIIDANLANALHEIEQEQEQEQHVQDQVVKDEIEPSHIINDETIAHALYELEQEHDELVQEKVELEQETKNIIVSYFNVPFEGNNPRETIDSIESGKKEYNPNNRYLLLQTDDEKVFIVTLNENNENKKYNINICDEWTTKNIKHVEKEMQNNIIKALKSIISNLYIYNCKGSKIVVCYIDNPNTDRPKYNFIRIYVSNWNTEADYML